MQERMFEGRYEYEKTPDIITFTDEELAQFRDSIEREKVSIYLYHGVPWNMRGTKLYPLNQLKSVYPDLYQEHAKKYDWRKEVMEERVPFLDCLWNDAIFLTAVNPRMIRHALEDAGGVSPKNWRCYQIDPNSLDPERTIVSLKPHETLSEENCEPYDPKKLRNYTNIPKETVQYYREAVAKNDSPLLYHRIPHILHEGVISVDGLTVMDV